MGNPHVIAIPYPAQGHVIPLMEVAQCLANKGVRVTFINTEFNHERVMKAFSQTGNMHELIELVSIPDGLSAEERLDHGKFGETIARIVPEKLEILIEEINSSTGKDEIVGVVADFYMGCALEVAEKLGIKKAAFMPGSVAFMATTMSAEKLAGDGIIDNNGTPLKSDMIQLSPTMPEMSPKHLPWCLLDLTTTSTIFNCIVENNKFLKLADRLICNTSSALESGALKFVPNCLPIGPLLASNRHEKTLGHFWAEDSTCLEWLDHQPPNSVIYVAFGSFTVFLESQFQELALGLEGTNMSFLWVVRQDMIQDVDESYPDGFKEHVKNRGKMVSWAPQQKVLSHPSVACFLTHCGWNSTLEGISNGVPLLCWPYFADQFVNQSYICDHWKIGLGLERDGKGMIRQDEISNKIEQLLTDDGYKTRSLELQKRTMDGVKGGCSHKNFKEFINWIKGN